MRLDYQKKRDEVKQMKERFSFNAKKDGPEKRSSRLYTERSYLF